MKGDFNAYTAVNRFKGSFSRHFLMKLRQSSVAFGLSYFGYVSLINLDTSPS